MVALLRHSYKLLGLTPQDSDATLKKRDRNLAKQYHPDHNASEQAHKQFHLLQQAYTLITEARKADLDLSMSEFDQTQSPSELSTSQAERMQRAYRAQQPTPESSEMSLLEFMGLHTALLAIVVIFSLLSINFVWNGKYVAAFLYALIPVLILSLSSLWPRPPAWRRYVHEITTRPMLVSQLLRSSSLILLNAYVLLVVATHTVLPIGLYLLLVLFPLLLYASRFFIQRAIKWLPISLHLLVLGLFVINYWGATGPQTIEVELISDQNIYFRSKKVLRNSQSSAYLRCMAVSYIPSSADWAKYKIFDVSQGALGIEVVGNLRYK